MLRSMAKALKQAPAAASAARQMATAAGKQPAAFDMTWLYGSHFNPVELIPLGTMMCYCGIVMGIVFKHTMMDNEQGSYYDRKTVTDIDAQLENDSHYKRSIIWETVRKNQDVDGFQVGLFREHERPHPVSASITMKGFYQQ